ncbi:hypothetical protein D1871_07440 [Nakamurella silvestris]|nr:hypothetical protein D1871_07440 [Nakamurella silvestris]
MNAQITAHLSRIRLLVAVGGAGLLLITACSSETKADPTSTSTPPGSTAPADTPAVSSIVVDPGSVTGAVADPRTVSEGVGLETTPEDEGSPDPASGDGGSGDPVSGDGGSTEGVCALATPSDVNGVLQASFTTSSFQDVSTVPECVYSSATSLAGVSVGVLTGGAAEFEDQVKITEMTAQEPKTTTEKVNGADATLFSFIDMIGYPEATILMVQGEDLLTASVTGEKGQDPAKVAKDAVILLGYLTSRTG